MVKKHHPHSRAERLALKELDEKPKERVSKARRKALELLKEQETEDELRAYRDLAKSRADLERSLLAS